MLDFIHDFSDGLEARFNNFAFLGGYARLMAINQMNDTQMDPANFILIVVQ